MSQEQPDEDAPAAQPTQPPTGPNPTVPTFAADENVWRSLVPAGHTLLFLVVAGVAFWLLSVGASDEEQYPLVGTKEWTIWRGVAALGQAAAISVGIAGALQLRRLWKAGSITKAILWAQVGVGLLFACLLVFYMVQLAR